MYEVPQDVQTLNLSLDCAADVFMVKMNPSETGVSGRRTRYIKSVGLRSADNATENVLLPETALPQKTDSIFFRKEFEPATNFKMPHLGKPTSRSVAGFSSSVGQPLKSVAQITPTEGSTTKQIWVDDTSAREGYSKKYATLRAVGTYCYVWVVDDYYSPSQSSGPQINATKAAELADKFDELYGYVRHIFGNESDEMVTVVSKNGQQYEDIQDITQVSNTGEMVNIVVYDIYDDYLKSENGGVYGYFWAKDYYSKTYAQAMGSQAGVLNYTNEGKYFYVDSYFANTDSVGIHSTLAHEFQHMINFGEKDMASLEKAQTQADVLVPEVWYNEMLSMLCEDMMQEKLGVADKNSPLARLPFFCLGYPYSGVIDWLDGDDVYYSYASAYTFGAYLARNFGGPALVKEIATNNYANRQSITKALQILGYNETFDSVFKKYAQALVLDNPNCGADVTLNKSAQWTSGYNGYTYPMKAIDIFNVNYEYEDKLGNLQKEKVAPYLLPADSSGQFDLRPYGFTLHSVGYTENQGTVVMEFSRPYTTSEKVYILVQPCTHNHRQQ